MKYQDIQVADIGLQQEFADKWLKGSYQQALDILDKNPQLDTKKFVSEIFNKIGNSLFAIEQIYHTDFINALQIDLDKYNEAINNFVYKEDWNNNISYSIGNTVIYNDSVYFCLKDNKNVNPSDTSYWVKLDMRGEQGKFGIDVVIKYDWDTLTAYNKADIVVYDEVLWYANQSNQGQRPSENSAYWTEFLAVPRSKIITSKQPPTVVYDGLIWNQILN